MKNSLLLLLTIVSLSTQLSGQDRGYFSGSLVSRNHFYFDDNLLNIITPADRFASNNYLWVQYLYGPVSVGIQYEAYMPQLVGYPYQYEGNSISHRFIRFNKGIIDVTAGNFFEQFGSGLSFRAYEERSLGINSSIDGVKMIFNPAAWLSIKGLTGRPRRFSEYADSYIRGGDAEIKLGALLKSENSFILGAGIVSRYSPYYGPNPDFPSSVNALNSRITIQSEKFTLYTEYVSKSADPDAMNLFSNSKGEALSLNSTLAFGSMGLFLSVRFLNEMNFQTERSFTDAYSAVNYLPSNTRQYSYALPNIYPYSTQAEGESSIRAEFNYSIPKNSKLGGRYGTDIRANYSSANSIAESANGKKQTISFGDIKYYNDINFELQRKWNKSVKSTFALQSIYFNRGVIEGGGGDDIIKSKIIIADMQFRLSGKASIRTELQHLWSDQDHGNWLAISGEINYAPHWSVYISDMTDYEYSEQVHFYSLGMYYRIDYVNIGLGYGRNREGYVCSGGICRKIPAYKGLNLSISASF